MTRRASLAFPLALLASIPLHAQNPAAVDLDRITVSASTRRSNASDKALPNTITIIEGSQLQGQLAVSNDLSQLLSQFIPSFSPPRQKMSNAGEFLRGRKPLYLLDGVSQSTPLREGGRDGHTLDPAMIERIEVIYGANALQGLGASGGIINIITKQAPTEVGETLQELTVGTTTSLPHREDSAGYRASYLLGLHPGRFDFVGGIAYAEEGLYYDGQGRALGEGDLMDSRSLDLFSKLGWNFDGSRRLQLMVNAYQLGSLAHYVGREGNHRTGTPATSVRGRSPGEPPRNRDTTASLDYNDSDLAGGFLQAQWYWSNVKALYQSLDWKDFWGNGRDRHWQDQSQIVSTKWGGKFSWSRGEWFGRDIDLTLGLDLAHDETYQELMRARMNWVPPLTYESWAPFVQVEAWIAGQVMLSAGLRHERGRLRVDDFSTIPANRGGSQFVVGGSRSSSETLPNLGLVWQAGNALKLYASYSEGYTVADIGRVLRAVNRPRQRVDTMLDLQPVIADNKEIGLDYDEGPWLAHLAAYRSHSDLGSRLNLEPSTLTYRVARERTQIHGVDGSVSYRADNGMQLGLAYSRIHGRYDSNKDGRVDSDLPGVNTSPNRMTAYWDAPMTQVVSFRVQASHNQDRQSKRMGVAQREDRFEGYSLVDVLARLHLRHGLLSIAIENLFDEQYISYYSQSTPRNDSYTSGQGRTLSLTWSQAF